MIKINDKLVTFNLGFLFIGTYFIYFLLVPILLYFNLLDPDLIYSLYTRKGLPFLTFSSLYYILTGLIFFALGYFIFFNKRRNIIKNINLLNRKWSFINMLIGSVILFSGGVFSKILGVLKGAHLHNHYWSALIDNQMINFFIVFNVLQILALIVIFYAYLLAKKEKNLFWKKIFFRIFLVLFVIMLLATLTHGSKALTLGIIFPILILYASTLSSKQAFLIVVGMFTLTIFIMVGKGIFEDYFRDTSNSQDVTVSERLDAFFGRVNQTHIVTAVVSRQVEPIGIAVFGEFYQHLKFKEYRKNIIQNGNEFAQDYGFIGSNDNVTGVGRTLIGGLYLSFGYLGIMLGMLFLGILYKIIHLSIHTEVGIIFYSFTLLNMLLRIEQDLIIMVNTLVFHLSIVLALHLTIMKGGIIDKFLYRFEKYKK